MSAAQPPSAPSWEMGFAQQHSHLSRQDTIFVVPAAWVALVLALWVAQNVVAAGLGPLSDGYRYRPIRSAPPQHGDPEDNPAAAADGLRSEDEEVHAAPRVPSHVQLAAGLAEFLCLASIAALTVVAPSLVGFHSKHSFVTTAAHSVLWLVVAVCAGCDHFEHARPIVAPPARKHISMGFLVGGFLVLALLTVSYDVFAAIDLHPWCELGLKAKRVGVLTALLGMHSCAHWRSFVDRPDVRRAMSASFWESLTFRWMWYLIHKRKVVARLEYSDCDPLVPEDNPARLLNEYQLFRAKGRTFSDAFWSTLRPGLALAVTGSVLLVLFGFIAPIGMELFLGFLDDREASGPSGGASESNSTRPPLTVGFLCCLLLFAGNILRFLAEGHAAHIARRTGFRGMLLLQSILANTILTCTKSATQVANAVTIAAVDARFIGDSIFQGASLWFLPMRIVIAMVLLSRMIGWVPVLSGISVMVLSVPLNLMAAVRVKESSKRALKYTDERLSLSSQALTAVRLVKAQVWEQLMIGKIEEQRKQELQRIVVSFAWNAAMRLLAALTPALVTIVGFFTHLMVTDQPLSPADVFTTLYLFNMLDWPMRFVPELYGRIFVSGKISWSRIVEFQEASRQVDQNILPGQLVQCETLGFEDAVLLVSPKFELRLSVMFPRQKFSVIVGTMGSGKTSVLLGLLREIRLTSGRIHVPKCSMALVEQTVFIQNGTLRENVTFGLDYDPIKFNRVMEACCLKVDLDMMPLKDQTMVGDHGVTMSGGQRQRLALARALYSDADIFLLDDILSAVDTVTANQLYHNALLPLVKQGKTVVLVSHAVSLAISCADFVVAMENGTVAQAGPPSQIQTQKLSSSVEVKEEIDATAEEPIALESISEEKRSTGSVRREHYVRYLRAFGMHLAIGTMVLLCITQAFKVQADIYLKEWSHNPKSAIFVSFVAIKLASVVALAFAKVLELRGSYNASLRLHQSLLTRVLAFPTNWFDVNPAGRVLNRLSNDLGLLDSNLIIDFEDFAVRAIANVASVIAIGISSPSILLICSPGMLLYFCLGRLYIQASRDMRRLAAVFFSPVVQSITEFQSGAVTIRAFRQGQHFMTTFLERVSASMCAYVNQIAANRWFYMNGDFAYSLVILGVSLSILIFSASGFDLLDIDPAWAAFALNYTLSLGETIRECMIKYTLLEIEMNSVERVGEYLAIDTEDQDGFEDVPEWPSSGPLEVRNLSVAYTKRDGEWNWTLHDVSFYVPPGAKVAIMGRSGSGKSTLFGAFMRMVPHQSGEVLLDNVPIHEAEVHYLRGQWGFVNQENYLFTGTLRENLDPNGSISDYELLDLLKPFRVQLPYSLDHRMDSSGCLSKGQSQLIGLLRSIVAARFKKARVFLCDEPTSAADHSTDALFWSVFRNVLNLSTLVHDSGCSSDNDDEDVAVPLTRGICHSDAAVTVIMIAHRVRTLVDLDSDFVVVLDQGHVMEFGHPRELLERAAEASSYSNSSSSSNTSLSSVSERGGWFARLVREAGPDDERVVRKFYGVPL